MRLLFFLLGGLLVQKLQQEHEVPGDMVRVLDGKGYGFFLRRAVASTDLDPFPHFRVRIRKGAEGIGKDAVMPIEEHGVAATGIAEERRVYDSVNLFL